jgi:hypothetical protein
MADTPAEATTTGRSPAEDAAISPGQSNEHGTHSHTPRPARGYSWPPFEPENRAAVKSGVNSPPIRAEKAEEIEPGFREWLVRTATWATGDEFELQRINYLNFKAAVELSGARVFRALAGKGTISNREIETYLSALRGELEALRELGLTVKTKAEMAHTVASTEATLTDLREQGRQTKGRQAALAEGEPFDGGGDDDAAA